MIDSGILKTILDSNTEDWIFVDGENKYIWDYNSDVEIKVEYLNEKNREKWANSFYTASSNVADKCRISIIIDGKIITSYDAVNTDSGNIFLLCPRADRTFTEEMYYINKIITEAKKYNVRGNGYLDDYLKMAGIQVDWNK